MLYQSIRKEAHWLVRETSMEDSGKITERCEKVMDRIVRLDGSGLISHSCSCTLLKLARAELQFLSSSSSHHGTTTSLNIGHLEAVVHLLELDFVGAVSRVCKPIPVPLLTHGSSRTETKPDGFCHVDIVCTLKQEQVPVWVIVSHRNPNYVSWESSGRNHSKSLKLRIEQLVAAASNCSQIVKPSSIILFFSRGFPPMLCQHLQRHFGAFDITLDFHPLFDFCDEVEDGDWINVLKVPMNYPEARVFQIKLHSSASPSILDTAALYHTNTDLNDDGGIYHTEDDAFGSIISSLEKARSAPSDSNCLLNFDTPALIALVSGISNGCTSKLLATPDVELRKRFKGNVDFIIAQSEIENPILEELARVVLKTTGIICESVLSEFKELVSLCGGPSEKLRANRLLEQLMVIPDCPSERMASLPTTRKLALKNKVVFGTGDHWRAPTLTANMAFVRAVSQTGMSLLTIEHRPRALTGD